MITREHLPVYEALVQKLRQELQSSEQLIWHASPDISRRAKQAPIRTLLPSWIVVRLFLLAGMFLVVFLTSVVSRTTTPLLLVLYGAIFLLVALVGIVLVVLRRNTVRRSLQRTLYAITNQRLLVMTLDREQWVMNAYYPADLGRIDCIERGDGWGDVVIGGGQRVQSREYSLAVMSPRLAGVKHVRYVATLLTQLKACGTVMKTAQSAASQ